MRLGSLRFTILGDLRDAIVRGPADPFIESVARQLARVAEVRGTLPADCATARAIDRDEPWEKIAKCAVDDGYVELAEELSRYVEASLRRGA